jgi:hypothetical protein
MNNALNSGNTPFLLTLKSNMTFEFAGEIEDMILDALRRYTHVQVDLSKVSEIDICGIHLLGLLESFANKGVEIIAISPAIEKAYERRDKRLMLKSRLAASEKALSQA